MRRSSVSAATAFSRMVEKEVASSGGVSLTRYGAASAWMAMTDMWCATTSCSSRAIRARSSSSVRRERSSAVAVCVSTTCCRSSRQARIAAAGVSTSTASTANGAMCESVRGTSSTSTPAAAMVTSHISAASRGRVRSTTRTITAVWVMRPISYPEAPVPVTA